MVRGQLFILLLPLATVSCQMKPYAPPPRPALVESVEVEVREFQGRPEAIAIVKGRLTSPVALLVDAKQSRIDRTLYLEVLEQTPRGATILPDLAESPPYETRIPIELLGLEPGPCMLNANGVLVTFEIPVLKAVLVREGEFDSVPHSAISLVDEFIPMEEAGGRGPL